jgi:hypothetical protein
MTRIESGVTIPKGLFTLYLNVKKVTAKIFWPPSTCTTFVELINLMVWGGISFNDRTQLVIVRNGSMTAARYRDDIIVPHALLRAKKVGHQRHCLDF